MAQYAGLLCIHLLHASCREQYSSPDIDVTATMNDHPDIPTEYRGELL
jgi:hypothetical protein